MVARVYFDIMKPGHVAKNEQKKKHDKNRDDERNRSFLLLRTHTLNESRLTKEAKHGNGRREWQRGGHNDEAQDDW